MLPFAKVFQITFLICAATLAVTPMFAAQPLARQKNAKESAAKPDDKIEYLEIYCFDEVNLRRKGQGLEPLVFSSRLLEVARNYSRRMAEEKFFSHTDPQGKTAGDRVHEAGLKWKAMGENLLNIKGYINPVPPAVNQWMQSPAHRRNILDPSYQYSAVGVWTDSNGMVYFTQLFLGEKQPKVARKK